MGAVVRMERDLRTLSHRLRHRHRIRSAPVGPDSLASVGGYWSESVWFDGTLRVNPVSILLSHYNETTFKTQRQQVAKHSLIWWDDRQQQISRRRSQSLNQSIDIPRIYSSPPQITKLPHLVELPHWRVIDHNHWLSVNLARCWVSASKVIFWHSSKFWNKLETVS